MHLPIYSLSLGYNISKSYIKQVFLPNEPAVYAELLRETGRNRNLTVSGSNKIKSSNYIWRKRG